MRNYSLLPGETPGSTITITLEPKVYDKLETLCRQEWAQLCKLDAAATTASPFVPFNKWIATREGRVHSYLAERQFTTAGRGGRVAPLDRVLSVAEWDAMMARLQAQRYHTSGRKTMYAGQYRDLKAFRKFRSWWVSREMAKQLNMPFSEPCPVTRVELSLPTESYIEIGYNFERWTGYRLVPELWDYLKAEEAKRLADKAASADVSADHCLAASADESGPSAAQ